MEDSEFRKALRHVLAKGLVHANPPSFGSPPWYASIWEVAIEEGWLTEAGLTTVRGRKKLNEVQGGHLYWFKSNAITIITSAMSVAAVVIAALALVLD